MASLPARVAKRFHQCHSRARDAPHTTASQPLIPVLPFTPSCHLIRLQPPCLLRQHPPPATPSSTAQTSLTAYLSEPLSPLPTCSTSAGSILSDISITCERIVRDLDDFRIMLEASAAASPNGASQAQLAAVLDQLEATMDAFSRMQLQQLRAFHEAATAIRRFLESTSPDMVLQTTAAIKPTVKVALQQLGVAMSPHAWAEVGTAYSAERQCEGRDGRAPGAVGLETSAWRLRARGGVCGGEACWLHRLHGREW